MDPRGAKWESCMELSSPIQELFVSSKQDMPPLSVIHPRSSPQLYRKQINCSNWRFDLMFCESGQSKALHCALWSYGDTLKCVMQNWWLRPCVITKEHTNLLTSPLHPIWILIFIMVYKAAFDKLHVSFKAKSYKVLQQSKTIQMWWNNKIRHEIK